MLYYACLGNNDEEKRLPMFGTDKTIVVPTTWYVIQGWLNSRTHNPGIWRMDYNLIVTTI